MPHVNIKHFPATLTAQSQTELVATLTRAVAAAFGCQEDAVSIALEPVPAPHWQQKVYQPEIVRRDDLLVKVPTY